MRDHAGGLFLSVKIPKSRGFAPQHFVVGRFQIHGQTAVSRGPNYLDGLSPFRHPIGTAVNARSDARRGPDKIALGLRTLGSLLREELNPGRGSNECFVISEFHVREPGGHGQVIAALKRFRIHELRVLFRIWRCAWLLGSGVGEDGDADAAREANAKNADDHPSHGCISAQDWTHGKLVWLRSHLS